MSQGGICFTTPSHFKRIPAFCFQKSIAPCDKVWTVVSETMGCVLLNARTLLTCRVIVGLEAFLPSCDGFDQMLLGQSIAGAETALADPSVSHMSPTA